VGGHNAKGEPWVGGLTWLPWTAPPCPIPSRPYPYPPDYIPILTTCAASGQAF